MLCCGFVTVTAPLVHGSFLKIRLLGLLADSRMRQMRLLLQLKEGVSTNIGLYEEQLERFGLEDMRTAGDSQVT